MPTIVSTYRAIVLIVVFHSYWILYSKQQFYRISLSVAPQIVVWVLSFVMWILAVNFIKRDSVRKKVNTFQFGIGIIRRNTFVKIYGSVWSRTIHFRTYLTLKSFRLWFLVNGSSRFICLNAIGYNSGWHNKERIINLVHNTWVLLLIKQTFKYS